jgi:hypothetical protein
MERSGNGMVFFLGMAFFLLGLAALANTLQKGNPEGVLWLCYIGIILIGIGMSMRKPELIASQLNILAIPLVVWTIDFFHFLLTGNELLGVTSYFFDSSFPISSRMISLQHIFTVPVSLYALYKLKPEKMSNSLRISLIQMILAFAVTMLLTGRESNINCVYESCMNLGIGFLPYQIAWFASAFALVFATDFLIRKILRS